MRMNYDLRDSKEDEFRRLLNAIKPGTVIPIHRHPKTSGDVVILRGGANGNCECHIVNIGLNGY